MLAMVSELGIPLVCTTLLRQETKETPLTVEGKRGILFSSEATCVDTSDF
jgi:hypothetical protein